MNLEDVNRILVEGLRTFIEDPLKREIKWIWYGFPREKIRYPMIAIFCVGSTTSVRGIGEKPIIQEYIMEISVVSDSKAEATINTARYSAFKLVSYLLDRVRNTLETTFSWFTHKVFDDIQVTRTNLNPYDPVADEYSGTLIVEVLTS